MKGELQGCMLTADTRHVKDPTCALCRWGTPSRLMPRIFKIEALRAEIEITQVMRTHAGMCWMRNLLISSLFLKLQSDDSIAESYGRKQY